MSQAEEEGVWGRNPPLAPLFVLAKFGWAKKLPFFCTNYLIPVSNIIVYSGVSPARTFIKCPCIPGPCGFAHVMEYSPAGSNTEKLPFFCVSNRVNSTFPI